jgi:hypothetical protein
MLNFSNALYKLDATLEKQVEQEQRERLLREFISLQYPNSAQQVLSPPTLAN